MATSFIEDRNGVLWFSTKGLGIMMYDRARDRFVAADERRALILRTMSEWEEMLPPQDFMRIHRKTIINLAYLDPARPRSSGMVALCAHFEDMRNGVALK